MGTKGKKRFRFLKIFSVFFLVLGIALGGAVLGLRMPQNSVSDTTVQTQGNALTLNQNFTENPYVIVGDRVYTYLQIHQQQTDVNPTTPTAKVQTLNFDNNGKLELVFYKENATQLNSAQTLQFTDEDIASQFQATKNEDGTISIQIIDTSDVVEITTSTDADYTLYGLAFSTQATLNYVNGEFSIGEKRSATSFTDTTAKSTTQILNLSGGSFKFSGAKTYSPKAETEGRAFYQTGGTLTLDGITLDGFWVNNTIDTNYGGAVLNMGGTLNLNCTIKNSNAYAGGAIGNMGVMNITGGTYSNNTALVGGGALANVGMATIDGGIFTENSSNYAGAIYNTMGQLTINDVAIYGNESVDFGGAIFNDSNLGYCYLIINGGEIYNNKTNSSGGAIANECSLTINGGEIYENTAGEYGGAVCLPDYENNAVLNITGGTFSQNTAVSGGAIYVYAKGTTTNVSTTISGGTFSENSAVYSESDTSQFSGGGGAIIVGNGTFDITGGEFLNNTATMGGGAIGSLVATNISNATFTGNMATDQEFQTLGGAVAFQNEVDVAISNCTFTENSSVLGSAVAALYGPTVTMSNCNVSGNQAMAGTLAALEADIMVMGSSTITQNQAMASTIAMVQGGIFGMDNNVSATENHSDMGAMMIVIEGYLGLTGCTVEDNTYGESLEIPGDIALIEDAVIIVAGELTSDYEVFVQSATAGTLVAGWLDSSMTSLMPTALEHLLLVGVDEETILTLNSENLIVIGGTGLAPGVYVYGTDELIYDWATLIAGGIISVSNGTISITDDALKALGSSLNGAKAKVVFDSSVTTIPDQFMAQASGIASLIFPSSITSVGMGAFAICQDLEEVIFKDSPVSFGMGAFMMCSALTKLDVGDNVAGYSAFSFAGTYLSEVSIHINANTSVEAYAFQCSFIKEITVDSNHPTMTSVNGIIYSKDYSVLALCPTGVAGEVTVLDSVQTVLAGAFFGCSNLSGTLTMPRGLTQLCDMNTEIGSGIKAVQLLAFLGYGLFSLAGMSSVVLPEGITELIDYTFSGCPNLSTITGPTNLQTIGVGCFKDCDGLIDVVIPNTVTSIGEDCFSGCDNLKTADLGDGITTICERLFYQAPALEWVDIGANTTTIQQMVFYQCPSLKTVVWNSALRTIGLSAFYQCSSLQGTFTAPSALTTISSHAFQECTSLTGVVFNSNLTELGDHAFQGCTGLTGTLTIPNSVTTISRQAFQDCSGLTGLSMGNSVTTIGDLAFYNCNQISGSLSLPDTLVTIGQSAFRNMPGLTGTLTLGTSMQTVGAYAFRDCTGFTTLYVYGNNLALGEQAFYNCTGLTTLNLNSGLLSIGDSAFYGCNKIYGRLTIPNTTTTIANNAFYNCSRFTGLTLGSSVTTIGDTAFYGCSGMSGSVTFPTTLQTIGKSAFRSLKLTGSINLPSIVTIGESAFQACTGFTSLKIGDTATTVDSLAFYGCTGLTSMDLGTGIQTIGQSAFRNCSNAVGTIKLPNIQVIGNYAFHTASKITSVTIGGTIQQVGDGVFANCTSILTHYYIDCTSIPTLTNANCFNNINANCKIWVPGALYEDWIVATNWSNWEPYIFAYYEQEGLFDANGNQLYTWRQMVSNGMITLSEDETTITASNITVTGNLIIPSSITEIGASAFEGNTTLTGVTFPDTLTKIGNKAFRQCTGLTGTLTLPDSLETIGNSAFYQCTNLTGTLTIPNNVTSVGEFAFAQNSGINDINLGNSLQTIKDSAFSRIGLPSGYTVRFPASVTSIGDYAFSYPDGVYQYIFDCRNLSPSVIKPSTSSSLIGGGGSSYRTKYIYPYEKAFDFITSEWITMPINLETYEWQDANGNVYTDVGGLYDNVTNERIYTWAQLISNGYITVEGSAITGSTDTLNGKLIISSTISTINGVGFSGGVFTDGAFDGRISLTHIVFQDSVASIGASAFAGCTGLTGVTFLHNQSANSLDIASGAFSDCTALTGVYTDGYDFFKDIATFANATSNPLYYAHHMYHIGGREITTINYGTTSFDGSNSIIGDYAFVNCLGLTSVTITGTFGIGNGAFNGCSNVLTYDFTGFNNRYTSLPECGLSFSDINANAQIIVPAEIYYEWRLAEGWVSYRENIVPNGTPPELVGGLFNSSGTKLYTWEQLVSNGSITLSESGLQITACSTSLSGNLIIPKTVNYIAGFAFENCTNLTGITIPNTVHTIWNDAFNGCSGLTGELVIPDSVKEIEARAFEGCSGITSLVIGSGLLTYGLTAYDIFKDCTSLASITFPSNLKQIGPGCFENCISLTGQLTIPDSVTEISNYAFSGCTGITSVVIGSGLTRLSGDAFGGCTNISSYYFNRCAVVPELYNSYILAVNTTTKIYVPSNLYSSWIEASGWSQYASNIVSTSSTSTASIYNLRVDTINSNYANDVFIVNNKEDDVVDDIDDANNDITGGGDGNNDGTNASVNVPTKTTTT